MQGKECTNTKEIGRENKSLIEDISKMVLSILEKDEQRHNLDSMENALTPILDKIRKKATERYFQSQKSKNQHTYFQKMRCYVLTGFRFVIIV